MAKHLSEGRAFPLFFYGQAYMLAVEAWWMVPFFWIGGPTVAALRASLVATNVAVVVLLVVGLVRWGERFVPDESDEPGRATCVDGEHLPFIGLVAARLATVVAGFVRTGERADSLVTLA